MGIAKRISAMMVVSFVVLSCGASWVQKPQCSMIWNFDSVLLSGLPEGWKVEATGRQSPMATWEMVKDSTAPSPSRILSLTGVNHRSWNTFNLCWTRRVSFLDGEIAVKLKANSGRIDQGGGVIWRVQDKNNYYVARFNPLEDNFRVYYVKKGIRHQIASARVHLPKGQWVTMRVFQKGKTFRCYLNGKLLLQGSLDVFPSPGGVGLWTKADAATSFDDFSVRLLSP
jgi:hypothetical protein